MNPTSFIAKRYLFARRHISLISALTMISITGITVGTALLIVVLSVFNGFFDVIKGLLLSYDPDVRIEAATGNRIAFGDSLQNELEDIPTIEVISPYVEGKALLALRSGEDQVVTVRGIHKDTFFQLNSLHESITSGVFDLSIRDQQPGLIMDERLMGQLGLDVGDELALISAAGMEKSLTQFTHPRYYLFTVRGGYSMQNLMDQNTVFVDMQAAKRLFNYRDVITGIDLKLHKHDQAQNVKKQLQAKTGDRYRISTWYDLQKPLYDVMYLEKWSAFVILMLIVLVAALNIIGSLTMIVIQKNRDIGVLMTLGYSRKLIKRIFLKQGLYVGLIGGFLGGALGVFLSWLQKEYGLIKLSSAFILDAYPVSIEPFDVAIILVGSLLLCLAASWYPASRAANVQPSDAVRYE